MNFSCTAALAGLLALSACREPAEPPAVPSPADTTAVPSGPPTVEQAATAADFEPFRLALLRAAEAHDSAAVAGLINDEIHWSFGGAPATRAAALDRWQLGDPNAPFWAAFRRMLAVGPGVARDDTSAVRRLGADSPTAYWVPWVHTSEPPTGEQPRETGALAVIDSAATVHAGRDTTSAVLARPGVRTWLYTPYGPVTGPEPVDAAGRPLFARVLVPGTEETGYIATRSVYSPYELRAQFIRKSGRWTMTICIAGD